MKILIIDGNSILNRAFYGIKILSTSKGFYTNAITGFMNIYLKELEQVKPDCVAVAFDLKAPTFRHERCSFYKATRKGMPEELAMQLPKMKELLKYLGVPILESEGYEADDILGSVAKLFSSDGDFCVILTGDRDSLQLISDSVNVRLVTNRETVNYDRDKFFEDYGVEPINLIDVKALMGDSSDNIPGVPGIGEKTALSLIKEYTTVENLYDNLSGANLTPGVLKKLENGRESAFTSKWLATIVNSAPIPQQKEFYFAGDIDAEACSNLLTELEMFRLISRLGLENLARDKEPPTQDDSYTLSELDKQSLKSLSEGKSEFIFDSGKLCVKSKDAVFVTDNEALILDYFESDSEKTAFEAKSAYKFAIYNNKELKNLAFSCDLAGYLLNSQSSDYTVSNLCAQYGVPYSKDENFAALLSLSRLRDALTLELEKANMIWLFREIELPLCEVLASMEVFGVQVDAQGIRNFGVSLEGDIADLEAQIYSFAGHSFNISSPKQLGIVLFEELGLPSGKKTRKGYSTDAKILEGLKSLHPIIDLVLEYRTLTKLKSTYVDGLLDVVYPDGRIRSEFKQTETRTGRISSANPNMQNIPVRKELGRNMRKFFVAKQGCLLLDADYSQIELRVLAAMCKDENMKATFVSGADIHTRTASQVFGVPEDMVDSDMRRAAKAVNFGIIYGIGAFSLSKDINVSVAEADRYIKSYLANFPGVDRFMSETVDFAVKNGYVVTEFGRRRYIPELKNSNKNLQAFGKRAAMNAPVQGTAADIIKIAMIKVYKRLKAEKLNARLILQVHDELIVEASEDCIDAAARALSEEMTNAVSLGVPLTADVNSGKSWYDAKG